MESVSSTSEEQQIKVAEFLSACVYLAEESGKIIRQVYQSGILNKQEKDNDLGPVTEADLKVQKNIEENLKALYPTLKVQGEESQDSIKEFEATVKPSDIPLDFIT